MNKILTSVFLYCFSILLLSCGGGSGGGGTPSTTTEALVGSASPLYSASVSNSLQIPIINSGNTSIQLGSTATLNPSSTSLTLDLASCNNANLTPGATCTFMVNLLPSEAPSNVKNIIFTIPATSNGSSFNISGMLNYQVIPSTYNSGVFISQSLLPLSINNSLNKGYTTIFFYNSNTYAVQFEALSLSSSGSGVWSLVASTCSGTLASGGGCYEILSYSNSGTNLSTTSSLPDNILSAATISAQFDNGESPSATISVSNNTSAHYSQILLTPINFINTTTTTVPIVNTGTIPITAISSSLLFGNDITINDTACQSEIPLAPDEACNLALTLSSSPTQYSDVLNLSYTDANNTQSVSTTISHASMTLTPQASYLTHVPLYGTRSTSFIITNLGSLAITYVGNNWNSSNSGYNPDITVDDSACSGQTLANGSQCIVKMTYSPSSLINNIVTANIAFSFNNSSGSISTSTQQLNYSSYNATIPSLIFCSASGSCASPGINFTQISSNTGVTKTKTLVVKNTGSSVASVIDVVESNFPASLTISNNTCSKLEVNESCAITLSYTSSSIESGLAILNLSYSNSDGSSSYVNSLEINYQAYATSKAQLVYCSDSQCMTQISSYNVSTQESTPISFTIYANNIGNASATNVNFTTGSNARLTAVSTCGSTMLPDVPCAINATYSPIVAETGSNNFTITESTSSSSAVLPVSYVATPVPLAPALLIYCSDVGCVNVISSIPSALTTNIGLTTATDYYIKNTGRQIATGVTTRFSPTVSSLTLSQFCSANNFINAGQICSFQLQYAPLLTESGSTSLISSYYPSAVATSKITSALLATYQSQAIVPVTCTSPCGIDQVMSCAAQANGYSTAESMFNVWFPNRDGFNNNAQTGTNYPNKNYYNYGTLVQAFSTYESFACTGTVAQRYQEVAAFFANVVQETEIGGTGLIANGLYHRGEEYCTNSKQRPFGQANLDYCYANYCNTAYPGCEVKIASRLFYGRGALQLSWNYNYSEYQKAFPSSRVFESPDAMLNSSLDGWRTAAWFWMGYNPYNGTKPNPHTALFSPTNFACHGNTGFAQTINVINGGFECGKASEARQTRLSNYNQLLNFMKQPQEMFNSTNDCSTWTNWALPC